MPAASTAATSRRCCASTTAPSAAIPGRGGRTRGPGGAARTARAVSRVRSAPRSALRDDPAMTDYVYKSVEITGTSSEGVTPAIDRGIAKASETLRNLDWFEVVTVRGHIDEGRIQHYQVTLKVGFRLEE